MHYSRWSRHGDPLVVIQKYGRTPCSIDGCGKPSDAHALCKMHLQRFERTGTTALKVRRGDAEFRRLAALNKVPWPGAPVRTPAPSSSA